jgi:hypothetical protein
MAGFHFLKSFLIGSGFDFRINRNSNGSCEYILRHIENSFFGFLSIDKTNITKRTSPVKRTGPNDFSNLYIFVSI